MQRALVYPITKTLQRHPAWVVTPATLFLIVVFATVAPRQPLLVVASAGAVGALWLATRREQVEDIFLISLFGLVMGYFMLGRSFAYIGAPPLYVGEAVLMLGLAALAFGRVRFRFTVVELLLLLFMLLGLARTIPYLGTNGVMAIRDAALWYYAIYAIPIALLLTEDRLRVALRLFSRVLPLLVVWLAFMPAFRYLPTMPHFPGSPEPIISVTKPGDRGVILVLMASFIISGLYARMRPARPMSASFFWTFWLASALMVSATNRGGMLAICLGLLLLMVLKPSSEWIRPALVGAVAVVTILIWNPTIDTGNYRQLSAQQLTTNVTSIFSNDTENLEGVQGTKEWRLMWWGAIYDDTVRGPDFWTGKGFGVNLATEYGYQHDKEHTLRSPHSAHMTVLARMGVPGLALWIALHLTFANTMIRAFRQARRRGDVFWSGVYATILPVWLAALIRASFDVYMEGPHGAIPFWCLFGIGLGALRIEHATRTAEQDRAIASGERYAYPARP